MKKDFEYAIGETCTLRFTMFMRSDTVKAQILSVLPFSAKTLDLSSSIPPS